MSRGNQGIFSVIEGIIEGVPALGLKIASTVGETALGAVSASRGSSATHESSFAGISEAFNELKVDFGALLNGAGIEPQGLSLGHEQVHYAATEEPTGNRMVNLGQQRSIESLMSV